MATSRVRLPPLFASAIRPFQAFFALEAASGILLLLAAVTAFLWANSPFAASYEAALRFPLGLQAGSAAARFTVEQLVNDGLMAVFFLLVGMEIKRELAVGELRTPSQALLPLIGALGGMAAPAAIYLAFTAGTGASVGWGIPMATDIAFSLACLSVVKKRVPNALVVFLTALAIFDDLGGILVIALFYGGQLHGAWLGAAAGVGALLYACNRLYVRNGLLYALLGAALWYALHHAGIHATIAGVALGMAIPARPARPGREILSELRAYLAKLLGDRTLEELGNEHVLAIEEKLEDLEPPLERFVHLIHPWVAFGIIPLFALANSGVALTGVSLSTLLSPVPAGTALGLFLGKQLGIFATTWAAVKLKVAPSPGGAGALQVYGVAVVGGIGFTVALFIATLAFANHPAHLAEAKLGIVVGSLLSAVAGLAVLSRTRHA